MRAKVMGSVLAAAVLAACDGDEPRQPTSEPVGAAGQGMQSTPRPNAGGSTRDFGGTCAPCPVPVVLEPIALDDAAAFGFSAEDMLALVEGAHEGTARWRDPCEPGACSTRDEGCPRSAPRFAGTTAVLRVAIESAAGEAGTLRCPGRAPHPECSTGLHVPVRLTVATDDGLLDEAIEGEIVARPGTAGGPVFDTIGVVVESVAGSLPTALPELGHVEWNFWPTGEGFEADLFVLAPAADAEGASPELLMQLEPVADGDGACRLGIAMEPVD
jgi:hypothetical protein